MEKTKVVICPYCGETQPAAERCRACGGLFEPLSRQATHNAMGPWFLRDPGKPFHPGCSYETVVKMVDRGQITKYSIVRGPTTRQFWTVAKHVPGVAHLLGYCHNCDTPVKPSDHGCHACGVPFGAYLDRNYMGLPEVRPLPWEADAEEHAGGPGREHGAGGRISGFATDAELLGHGQPAAAATHPGPAAPRAPRVPRAAGAAGAPQNVPAPDGHSVFDEQTSSAVARALRRRLASQQRTTRLMAFLAVAALVILVVTNFNALSSMFGRAGSAVVPPDEAQEPVATGGATAIDAAAEPGEPAEPPAEAPPPDEAPAAGADAPEAAQTEGYAALVALITAAGNTDRSLDERLNDYAQALVGLQAIIASVAPDDRPGDLGTTIEHVEREIERLRLKNEFFD